MCVCVHVCVRACVCVSVYVERLNVKWIFFWNAFKKIFKIKSVNWLDSNEDRIEVDRKRQFNDY